MKKVIAIVVFLSVFITGNAQEKRISFKKGTLKICTSSQMKISGYDGNEVIIKSLNNNIRTLYGVLRDKNKKGSITGYNVRSKFNDTIKGRVVKDSILTYRLRSIRNHVNERELEKGLSPLGTKSTNPADNLFLDIEQKSGELIIKDYESDKKNIIRVNNQYELLIPNTIKLEWNTGNCEKTKTNTFFITSKPWELSNFKGEVEISSSYGSIALTDVSGPVLANTVGGNIKVVFDKVTPKSLYSLISSDGHIDIQLPKNASLNINASGSRILSDLDFKVITENLIGNNTKVMNLELNGGSTKMKLNAGYGNVYLRKN